MCLSAKSRPADEHSVVVADNVYNRRGALPGQSWDILAKTNKQFHRPRHNVIYTCHLVTVTNKKGSQLIEKLFDLTKQGRLREVLTE